MYSDSLEPMVCTAVQREQRVDFQRHEPHIEQQQREQLESGRRGHEFTEHKRYTLND